MRKLGDKEELTIFGIEVPGWVITLWMLAAGACVIFAPLLVSR